MSGLIGHNKGPSMEGGHSWRRHVWTKARADLLPKLPLEVVRLRVRRAKQLGLPYKTYAGIRATTGHDLIGFLFSANGLGLHQPRSSLPLGVVDKLDDLIATKRLGLETFAGQLSAVPLDHCAMAPRVHASWSTVRKEMQQVFKDIGQPADRFVIIGNGPFEPQWAQAAKTAGFLTGDAYFQAQ